MRKSILICSLFATMGLVCFQGAFQPTLAAKTEEVRIAELETRVSKLEARLGAVEEYLRASVSPAQSEESEGSASVGDAKWKYKANWEKVKTGMSFDQVRQILGEPTKKDMALPNFGTWYYEGHVGSAGAEVSGNIFFGENRVVVVSAPVF